MLVMGPPLYQRYILLQNCHCMIASLMFADANYIINPLKTPWRAATGRREARGEDGLLNQFISSLFSNIANQLTTRPELLTCRIPFILYKFVKREPNAEFRLRKVLCFQKKSLSLDSRDSPW